MSTLEWIVTGLLVVILVQLFAILMMLGKVQTANAFYRLLREGLGVWCKKNPQSGASLVQFMDEFCQKKLIE